MNNSKQTPKQTEQAQTSRFCSPWSVSVAQVLYRLSTRVIRNAPMPSWMHTMNNEIATAQQNTRVCGATTT